MDTMTQAEYAMARGWAKSYVTKLKQEGRLVLTDDGRVRVQESDARIRETEQRTRAAAPVQDPIGGSMQAARAVKEKYLALTAKRDYEESCGQLMESAKVQAFVADAVITLRARIETLPVTAGPLLAAENDESRCVALLREMVEQCLTELAEKFSEISAGEGQS